MQLVQLIYCACVLQKCFPNKNNMKKGELQKRLVFVLCSKVYCSFLTTITVFYISRNSILSCNFVNGKVFRWPIAKLKQLEIQNLCLQTAFGLNCA